LILPLVLILCLSAYSQVKDAETSSEDLEQELRATIERLLKAHKEHDLDTMFEIEGDSIGYGYRTKAPRVPNEKLYRFGNKMFWDSMESFEITANEDDFVY